MTKPLSVVDKLVKENVLNYPCIFPTRLHVLEHCLLGNGTGYEWVKKEDGLLYLEKPFYRDEILSEDTIKMEIAKDGEELHPSARLDNHLRQFIQDNIDEYCKKSFNHLHTDRLLPRARYYLVSENYNRLDEIDDLNMVAPEWVSAIKEVCEHFMTDIAQLYSGSPYLNCLEYIRCPMFSKYYAFLQKHLQRIKKLPKYVEQDAFLQKCIKEILDGKD